MLRIRTLSGTVPANRLQAFEVHCTAMIPLETTERIAEMALSRVKEKYPEAINPIVCAMHLTRRENEEYVAANCEVNIGDGDYVYRIVNIELSEFIWDIKNER